MSTNYYFRDEKARYTLNNLNILFLDEEIKEQLLNKTEKLHIGQYAGGWAALLKKNDKYYTNVDEMKHFYEKNKDRLIIIDEYNSELTWRKLEIEFINQKGKSRGDMVDKDGYCWSEGEFC